MKGFARLALAAAVLVQLAACAGIDRSHEEALNWAADIDVTQVQDDVAIRLPENVLFDFGSSDLRADTRAAIARSAAIVARSDKPVVVEGHTDNVGSRESNRALSEARAQVVAAALERDGIPAARMTIRGYASDHPIADNNTAEGRTQNRRAEIRIVDESVDKVLGKEAAPSRERPAMPAPAGAAENAATHFIWPAQGHVAQAFVEGKTRGMLMAGNAGEPVKAVASGFVVYAGNAVEAYGPLVIVQHRDGFVTAYAHNGRVLVKSRQTVAQGQPIAEMGADANGNGMLQFEIRRNGQQLDPLKYLPEAVN
ncbi:peptidoglycan DD-metalloendopeptidase family protein [Paraburkholderia acidipaludis]|uniref:peptidoglycan DD-metalloendopeptidase family protein n=1 Tax=Paraburkholderia acidipaludis TaxID=660537 RepID=UPI000AD2B190|nr:peptidoglycan DD-metalloendopeptidase family protein [Paraburkholderia acidipaludis]